MENQSMSSSSSSTPNSEELKNIIVAMEESTEKASRNNDNMQQGSPQEVASENRIDNPSFGLNGVQRGREIMKFYPSKSDKIYTCYFCKKGFSTSQALGGHQNAHKQEREWDKKRKEMEADFPGLSFLNPFLDKPHILLGGYSQDALSNENHLGITLDPCKRLVYPSFNNGGINNMNMTIVPRVTPTRFFTGSTSTNGSAPMGLSRSSPSHNMYPLIPRKNPAFPPPPQPTNGLQENVLREKNFISKIGMQDVVEIDDDEDQPEEGKSKSKEINLSLSL